MKTSQEIYAAEGFCPAYRAAIDREVREMYAKADLLAAEEICLQNNDGTFGASECLRATGTGDTKYGTYHIYERVSGGRRVEGCDPATAPGYARHNPNAAAQLKSLRSQWKELRDAAATHAKQARRS